MKFLIDMNLSPLWVRFLADHGLEVVHWSTVGQPNAADSDIQRKIPAAMTFLGEYSALLANRLFLISFFKLKC